MKFASLVTEKIGTTKDLSKGLEGADSSNPNVEKLSLLSCVVLNSELMEKGV